MSVSATSGFARLLAYNAGVGGSNPSPPTAYKCRRENPTVDSPCRGEFPVTGRR